MKGVEMKCVCKIRKSMVEQVLCNATRQRREKTVREGTTNRKDGQIVDDYLMAKYRIS